MIVNQAIETLKTHDFEQAIVKNEIITPLQDAVYKSDLHGRTVRFLYHALRDDPINEVFANFYAGFLTVKDAPNLFVGVNLVEPEGSATAIKDYDSQMEIIKYMQNYFQEHFGITIPVSLHAGELTPQVLTNSKQDLNNLKFHIHDAVTIAGAQRIGHGVDINYELGKYPELLNTLKQKNVMIETNLTSNEDTMGVCLDQSFCAYAPALPLYLNYNVPTALSTDDEGVENITLSDEYSKAVSWYNLPYATMKNMDRNSLSYSFLPGKDLWIAKGNYEAFTSACASDDPYTENMPSPTCSAFFAQNLKANLEWQLEESFKSFESSL